MNSPLNKFTIANPIQSNPIQSNPIQSNPHQGPYYEDVANPAYPSFYFLDVGNICNLRCPFCQTGKNVRSVERGTLSKEHFDIIIEKISPHAKFISMINWGEPFLNKNILHFFSRCRELGIRTHIDSNLSLRPMSEEEAEKIVTSGIGAILASIDGATQEGYSRYRVNGDLKTVLHNLRLLREARDKLELDKPFLGWSFLINKFNEHEIEQARAMAADIGVDIWFKLLSCEDPSWHSKYHSTPNDPVLAIPAWIGSVYPVEIPQSLTSKPLHPELTSVCYQPFSSMAINWNGDVYPCCVVYGDEFKLGNLVTQDFDEIWFGNEFTKCRSFLRHYGPEQDSESVCQNRNCALHKKAL